MKEYLYALIIVITYNLIFLCFYVQFFYVIINPTCQSYIFHILQGHHSGTHLLILNLKALRDSGSFISLGAKSHIFGPRQITDSVPCQTEFTLLLLNELL